MTELIPTEPRTELAFVELPEIPLAAIRHTAITFDEIGGAFDAGYPALGAAHEQSGLPIDVLALAVYHGDPMATFDLEVASSLHEPLAAAVEANGLTVEPSHLPAGRYASLSHLGSYDGLGETWQRLMAGVREAGSTPTSTWTEVYVSDPTTTAPADLRTDLYVSVTD